MLCFIAVSRNLGDQLLSQTLQYLCVAPSRDRIVLEKEMDVFIEMETGLNLIYLQREHEVLLLGNMRFHKCIMGNNKLYCQYSGICLYLRLKSNVIQLQLRGNCSTQLNKHHSGLRYTVVSSCEHCTLFIGLLWSFGSQHLLEVWKFICGERKNEFI